MARIDVTMSGVRLTTAAFSRIEKNLNRGKQKLPVEIARNVRKRIKSKIVALHGHSQTTAGHNTPTPLLKYLSPAVKGNSTAIVKMMEGGEGKTRNLPLIVENGAKPHRMEKIRYDRDGVKRKVGFINHPGFKPGRKYFKSAVREYETTEFRKQVKRWAKTNIG